MAAASHRRERTISARHRIALGLLATVGATPAAAQAAPNWAEPVVIADLPSWSAVALADDELLISRATALSMAPVRTRFELGGSVSGDPFRAAISEDGVPNGANRVAGPLVANAGGAAVACAAVIGETGTGIHGRTVAHHRPSADAPWSTIEFPLDAIADGLGPPAACRRSEPTAPPSSWCSR